LFIPKTKACYIYIYTACNARVSNNIAINISQYYVKSIEIRFKKYLSQELRNNNVTINLKISTNTNFIFFFLINEISTRIKFLNLLLRYYYVTFYLTFQGYSTSTKLVIAIFFYLDDLIIALQEKTSVLLRLVSWNRDQMCHVQYTSCIQIVSLTHDKLF